MYFYYELAGLAMREACARSSVVDNAINYSLLGAPERKAYIWCQINVLI